MKNNAPRQKRIKTSLVMMALLAWPVVFFGQETWQLTLEKARALATTNHPEIAAGRLDDAISAEVLAEARLKRLPQVYADLNMQRNLVIPVTPVPANAFDPTAPEGKLLPLRFTTRWTANTGINASYDVFNPQQKLAIAEAEIKREITKLDNESKAADLLYEVGAAYIAALIAAEQLRLSVVDTFTKAERLKVSQQQYNEGRLLLATLNSIKADRNNTLNNFEEARKIYANSKAKLLYAMGFAPDEEREIRFLDSLQGLYASYQKEFSLDTLNSFSLNRLKLNEALLETQAAATRNSNRPSLVIKGYYGANYFDNSFNILKSANWNGNSFVNLGLRLPVTERLDRQRKLAQLNLQQQANRLRYNHERAKNRLDYLAATREAAVLEKQFARARENFLLADENRRLAEQQFASGRLLFSELAGVHYDYEKEKNTYLNIAYNFLSAQLNAERLSRN